MTWESDYFQIKPLRTGELMAMYKQVPRKPRKPNSAGKTMDESFYRRWKEQQADRERVTGNLRSQPIIIYLHGKPLA